MNSLIRGLIGLGCIALLGFFLIILSLNSAKDQHVDYCIKYDQSSIPMKCLKSRTLLIPKEFSDSKRSEDWYRLELGYPDMVPWNSASQSKRNTLKKIVVDLKGQTTQTVEDLFFNRFLGSPKPMQQGSVYGLSQYLKIWGGQEDVPISKKIGVQIFRPIEDDAKILIECAYMLEKIQTGTCTVTMYTDWHLKVVYEYEKELLSEWKIVNFEINNYIESLIVQ